MTTTGTSSPASKSVASTQSAESSQNPLVQRSELPYELPPFDKVANADLVSAFTIAMQEHQRECAAIADNQQAVSFDNTLVALERSGRMLSRVDAVFSTLAGAHTNEKLQRIEVEMAPKLSAHWDGIYLNEKLFSRIAALYAQRASLRLDPESDRLLERTYVTFVRAGAKLSAEQKRELSELNQRLASLATEFQQNVLKNVNASAILVDDPKELAGLSSAELAAAAEAAKERGAEGKWLLTLMNTTGQPLFSSLANRDLRKRLLEASLARGLPSTPGQQDNTRLIAEMVKLRAKRANLLGYPTHADYVTADETAKTPAAVKELLNRLVPPAVRNAQREALEIQKLIDQQERKAGRKPFKVAAWDFAFYAEQVRRAKFAYDQAEVKPYFELDRVLKDGVMFAAQSLYGLEFRARQDLPTYHPDVRVFEVFDSQGGALGLLLVDWFARPSKRGGAWMSGLVPQSELLGTKPVVTTNLNIPKPPDGEKALLTFDEVNTAFHEFGHALHGLLSKVKYPTLSGTNVPRDYVEYPSQYNEMWATEPAVLQNYARHHVSGEAMPKALMEKVLASRKFNQGYVTTEYLAAVLLDQAFHSLPESATPSAEQVPAFEAQALKNAGLSVDVVPPRYRSSYFSHIFADALGYSAGYYAYIWSEVLARDTEAWFSSHGGLSRSAGDTLRTQVLSKGNSVEPLQAFESFYGRTPNIEPLLEKRGLLP